MSTVEQLKSRAAKRRYIDAEVDGVPVKIRTLTAAEQCEFEGTVPKNADGVTVKRLNEIMAGLIVLCACDCESLEPCLGAADIEWLLQLDNRAFETLLMTCAKHTGFGEDMTKKAKKN